MRKSNEKPQRLVCRFIIPSPSTSSSSSQSGSEIDANSICGGDDERRPKNVLIQQQRFETPKKEKKVSQWGKYLICRMKMPKKKIGTIHIILLCFGHGLTNSNFVLNH